MNPYVLLAKKAVEEYVKQGKIIDPPKDLDQEFLTKKAGIFITIEKNKELRACLGTYLPTRPNIAQEIIENAVSAASDDYRFKPIEKQELCSLSYTVSVLEYPEQVKNIKEIDPKEFGIIVKTAPFVFPDTDNKDQEIAFKSEAPFKSGLLLPDLEGVETPEEQFKIACEKAGINPLKEKVFIYKFKVKKFQ